MKTNYLKNLAVLAGLATLVACSSGSSSSNNGGSNGGNTGDLSKLTFTAPNIIPSMPTLVGQGYIVANNTGTTALNNLSYTVTSPIGGGSNISVDQVSAAGCKEIPAQGYCIFKVKVPAGTVAGSFVMNANQSSGILGSLLHKLTSDITPSTVIGIQQAQYNTLSGPAGIGLFYYTQVIAGTTYVVVTGSVNSAKVGNFNNVVLVDGNNNVLANQQSISGNLGAGLTNLTQGAVFALMVPVPAGSDATQVIKIQTQEVAGNGTVSNVQTGTASYNLSTTSGVGIVNLFPEAVYLTQANPEQIITFYNNGDVQAQLQSLVASNPNIQITFNPGSVGINGTATATLKLVNTSVAATTGSVTLNYNNGKSNQQQNGTVDQNIDPAPSPTPTPSPSPTAPPVPPAPAAGLTATLTPNNFDVTTATLSATRVLKLKNTGNTSEAGFSFTFTPSSAFSLSAGPAPACAVNGNTITNTLAADEECNLNVSYTSPNTTAGNHSATMDIAYTYNGGTAAPTPFNTTVNANVGQSSANLSSTASSVTNFGNVLNNNTAVSSILYFKLQNSGEVSATGLNFVNSNGLFSITTTGAASPACNISGSGTLANGAECNYGIQFGPIPSSTGIGVQNNTTTISGNWTSGGVSNTSSGTQATSGSVVAATSAAIALSGPVASGFANDAGPAPYQIQENSAGKLTYTYTNSGTQAATSFYVANTSLPSGWTRSGGSCPSTSGSAITLSNANGTCTVEFTINSNTVATNNFNQNVMTAHWVDQANPGGDSQAASSSSTGVNVYATPAVTAVMSSSSTGTPTITNPTENTDFYVVYTLSGGYSGQSFTYGVTLGGTPGSPAMAAVAPVTCTITSPATSCSIKIASGGVATNQSITYTPQSGVVTPTPSSSGNFNVSPLACNPCSIFVTPLLQYSGDLLYDANNAPINANPPVTNGFDGGDAICQYYADSSGYQGTYKALVAGTNRAPGGSDWVIQAGVTYVRASDTSVTIATATESSVLPSPLTNPIDTTFASVVTGFLPNANPWRVVTPADFPSTSNCSDWSAHSASDSSIAGAANAVATYSYMNPPMVMPPTVNGFLTLGQQRCDGSNTTSIYCVQQR